MTTKALSRLRTAVAAPAAALVLLALVAGVGSPPATAARRLGWIAERQHDPIAALLLKFVGNDGYVPLDPKRGTADARRNARWRVLENIEIS